MGEQFQRGASGTVCGCAACTAMRDNAGYFLEAYKPGDTFRFETLQSQDKPAADFSAVNTFDDFTDPEDMEQGIAAPVLRKVQGVLVYVAVFAAGWFASALCTLARLKGWL